MWYIICYYCPEIQKSLSDALINVYLLIVATVYRPEIQETTLLVTLSGRIRMMPFSVWGSYLLMTLRHNKKYTKRSEGNWRLRVDINPQLRLTLHVYKLDPSTLHIYIDLVGALIRINWEYYHKCHYALNSIWYASNSTCQCDIYFKNFTTILP